MNPKNEAVEAYMKEHRVSRVTAYRKLKATVSPTVPNDTVEAPTVSKSKPTVSTVSKQPATVSPTTYALGPGSSKNELPRRVYTVDDRVPEKPLATQIVEKHYGKLLPATETFTLMDGTVIPIRRREFPNGK